MKRWLTFSMAMLLVAGLAGVTEAREHRTRKDHSAPTADAVTGTVVKIDGANLVIKNNGAEQTVATDDKTTVIINGTTSKLADLKADQTVKVTPSTGTAAKIEVGATDPPVPPDPNKRHRHKRK